MNFAVVSGRHSGRATPSRRATPKTATHDGNRQRFHLSSAKTCPDKAGHLCIDPGWPARPHRDWLASVGERAGLGELDPQPYWGFADLEHKAGTKLLNAFYVQAEVKTEGGRESYWYRRAMRLERFAFPVFLDALEQGKMLVDFDARSGHNHGTKFRMRQDCLPMLYEKATVIVAREADQLRQAA
jgi:hypothetical protein